MSEIKTKVTDVDVYEFIESFANTERKKQDSYELIKMMQEVSGEPPKMWGPTMIGFGKYHYKSNRSKQEGDWFVIGFSPRKAAISVYVYSGTEKQDELLKSLGKYKMGKACIYVNKLADINLDVLKQMMIDSIKHTKEVWG
ncbi:MAG: DUF1801 domain-containing protein [Tissierellia bacterium]|nr:DUF1801 domain-containing protein [Tissierellia bacterium]